MRYVTVNLKITADEYLKVYKGVGKTVFAENTNGMTIKFPANILQSFVTREGISGVFNIYFDDNGKFFHIEKISDL